MDTITKSQLDNFITKLGFDITIPLSEKFEFFSSYSLLSHEINANLLKSDLEEISTGQSKGIDTIAFCINEKLILNSDEVDNFEKQGIIVDIYFLQSKTSENFNDSELAGFLDVVIDFFSDDPQYVINEFDNSREILKKILDKHGKQEFTLKDVNIYCYYVTLGQKQEKVTSIDSTINIKKDALRKYALFTGIAIELVDKQSLITKHKKAISPLKATFNFINKIPLTGIPNVDEAYIGFAPFSEFKNLIMDESQVKLKSLFNDNLRDFLGIDNPINSGIKKTLEAKKFNEFSLLNNGVTVIADSNTGKGGNNLILENYQIVNGCQTSNVLFECKQIPNIDSVQIPLKVIITKDEKLRDEIILTTNSQSSFTDEQLFAITQFQKVLEDYYASNRSTDNIFYERRTNQYSNMSLSRSNIIEIKEQLKSFMAMFFDLPHLVAGNIGKIIKNYRKDFFQKEHQPIAYYISGLISVNWEKLLQKDTSYKDFVKYRYHIFMGFRYIIEDVLFQKSFLEHEKNYSVKRENGSRINSYEKLLMNLRDPVKFKKNIDSALNIFKQTDFNRKKGAYSNPITQEYKRELQKFLDADTYA